MALNHAGGRAAPSPDDATARKQPLARALAFHSAAPLGYLAAAALLWRHVIGGLGTRAYGGADSFLFTWWVRWTPFAISNGHLPFRSGWLGYPHGVNAMWNTSVLLLGLLVWPITAVAGPLVAFNCLLITAPAVSAVACYGAAYSLVGSRKRAALAGLLYGFSPFFIGQSAGHLHLTWAAFPPLVVWLFVELFLRQTMSTLRLGLALGLATGLQLLIGEELLASTALLALLSLLVLAALHPHEVKRRAPYALAALGVGLATAAVLDALPLYIQFFGPQRVHGPVQSQAPGADLLSFVLPPPLMALHGVGALSGVQDRVLGPNLAEQTAYLGLPMLLLVLWTALRSMRERGRRLLLVPLALAFVLTLGRSLVVGGHATGFPLPAAAMARLPLLQSMLPVRFSLYVDLFAALLVSASIARTPGALRAGELVVLGLALATLMPLALPAYPVSTPSYFTAQTRTTLPTGAAVFVAPYPGPGAPAPMLWQAMSGMRFRMMGGYFVGPDVRGHAVFGSPPGPTAQAVSAIQHGAPVLSAGWQVAVARELRADRIDAVVVGPIPQEREVVAFFTSALHTRGTWTGGVWLFGLHSLRQIHKEGKPT